MITLGLDIGSNSVGSAWIDTESRIIKLGVSVFPAGVDETDTKRGAPINQKRRQARSLRRCLARRSSRKRALRKLLTEAGLLPKDPKKLKPLFDVNPWLLRREALERPLHPHEFGRVLVHLNQRRGAIGVASDDEDDDGRKVKKAIDKLQSQIGDRTFGQFMADLMDERKTEITGKRAARINNPIRNRRDSFEFHADRTLIREEFNTLWAKQRSFQGTLSKRLTNELRLQLDDPERTLYDSDRKKAWRDGGAIFGQRRTYWNAGTLGRCDLEPTDHRCPIHDMHAQAYRVIETVNNIRITERGKQPRALTPDERNALIAALRKQKTGSIATVRRALRIDGRTLSKRGLSEDYYRLNLERDEDREINTDRFYRDIVHGVFGEKRWQAMSPPDRDSVNRALLKFDRDDEDHETKLLAGAQQWWGARARFRRKTRRGLEEPRANRQETQPVAPGDPKPHASDELLRRAMRPLAHRDRSPPDVRRGRRKPRKPRTARTLRTSRLRHSPHRPRLSDGR